MAGIYIHIPFCLSRCIYCDFYSTTAAELLPDYVDALCREMALRRSELEGTPVATVYIGGGTPSVLSPAQLQQIDTCLRDNYDVVPGAEYTVELNPDDVGRKGGLLDAGELPFNRASMGIQTLDDRLLRLLRRRHDADTAIRAVDTLRRRGIGNISVDLIYGLPTQTLEAFTADVDAVLALGTQHLSAYALSYEPGTPLHAMRRRGEVQETDEEVSVAMYETLCRRARQAGFEHYELSNFALPGRHSRHNSAYWQGVPYIGFGPAAHSYDGRSTRRANTPSLTAYLRHLSQDGAAAAAATGTTAWAEMEHLTTAELYDEHVMCALRTRQGISLTALRDRFGSTWQAHLMHAAAPHIAAGRLCVDGDRLHLAHSALMVADDVMSDLMA